MKRYINKLNSKHIEDFLVRANTGSIQRSEGMISKELFKYCDETKVVIAYLEKLGLDVFKRGTKEPLRIGEQLASASWEVVKQFEPSKNVRTFADAF